MRDSQCSLDGGHRHNMIRQLRSFVHRGGIPVSVRENANANGCGSFVKLALCREYARLRADVPAYMATDTFREVGMGATFSCCLPFY